MIGAVSVNIERLPVTVGARKLTCRKPITVPVTGSSIEMVNERAWTPHRRPDLRPCCLVDSVSDRYAAESVEFHLRWKDACGIGGFTGSEQVLRCSGDDGACAPETFG